MAGVVTEDCLLGKGGGGRVRGEVVGGEGDGGVEVHVIRYSLLLFIWSEVSSPSPFFGGGGGFLWCRLLSLEIGLGGPPIIIGE